MASVLRMPKLGLEMEQGAVVEWHVAEGDQVAEGDVVAEIESEKTIGEIEATESGVVRRIVLDVGEAGPPGAALAVVAGPDEPIDYLTLTADAADVDGTEPVEEDASGDDTVSIHRGDEAMERAVRATPRAKRLADEHGVALDAVDGTAPGGAVVGADVERAASRAGDAGVGSPDAGDQTPGVASRATLHREIRVGQLEAIAETLARRRDANLSLMDLFFRLLSATLAAHPAFNARVEGGEHRPASTQNVGYSVATDRGVVTSVIAGLESRSITEIAAHRSQLVGTESAAAADEGTVDDTDGHETDGPLAATFSVTNLGQQEVDAFTPGLDPAQVASLGLGRVHDAPARDDGEGAFERTVTVSLTVDQRVVDAADGADFLATFAAYADEPELLLLGEP